MKAIQIIDGNSSLLSVAGIILLLCPGILSADRRLDTGELPEPIVSTEDCISTGSFGWGWDGEQPCRVTNTRFDGAALPLTQVSSDHGGTSLAWSRGDLANKTVRCDSYELASFRAGSGYTRDRYDITFLTENTIPASAGTENLSDVTAHLYTRGWEIGQFGVLDSGAVVNFSRPGFATEKGYIFIEETSRNSDNENIVSEFSHCYIRGDNAPLRATGYCVDFDGDGVGWNGTAVCEVVPVDANCDYRHAAVGSNVGWGYNTVTGESCPPIGNPTPYMPIDECIGRGEFGWNEFRQESCRLEG